MAQDLGRRLLGEVEVVGFGEIIELLRLRAADHQEDENPSPLHQLLFPKHTTSPLAELISFKPDPAATALLYHLTATSLLSHKSCAVIVDCDGSISIPVLGKQLHHLIISQPSPQPLSEADINEQIHRAFQHLHIFRPQTLASLLATIGALPGYLFNGSRHYSIDRTLAFVAVHSTTAFYWADRAEVEDARANQQAHTSGFVKLAAGLKQASKSLGGAPVLTTSWGIGAPLSGARRFVVRRAEVRKFPAGFSVEEALREAGDRLRAVEAAPCEVVEQARDGRKLAFRIANGLLELLDESGNDLNTELR